MDGVEFIRKRRRLAAALIIPPGNLYLQLAGNPSIVLTRARWLAWERAIDEATGRSLLPQTVPADADPHSLWYRRIPGVSLQQLLADELAPLEQKFEALRWSLVALRALHACNADWGKDLRQSISHGDATAANVIVDVDASKACWIDFETRHLPEMPALDRQADDVRALIDSAALHLPASSFPRLGELLTTDCDETVLETFARHIASKWRYPTVAQLAQSPLGWTASEALRESLLQSLETRATTRARVCR